MAKAKTPAKPIERPKKGKGSGKPNRAMKAKAMGIDLRAIVPDSDAEPLIVMECDAEIEPALGRPAMLTPELGSRVCSAIAQGVSWREIEAMPGMPREQSIYRWLAHSTDGANGKLYAAFRDSFTRARQLRAITRPAAMEKLIDRLAHPQPGDIKLDPTAARVAIDAHQFLMKVEDPGSVPGTKIVHQGDPKNPLRTVTRHELDDGTLEAIAAGLDIDNAG